MCVLETEFTFHYLKLFQSPLMSGVYSQMETLLLDLVIQLQIMFQAQMEPTIFDLEDWIIAVAGPLQVPNFLLMVSNF